MIKIIIWLSLLCSAIFAQINRVDSLFSKNIIVDSLYTGSWVITDFHNPEYLFYKSKIFIGDNYQLYYDSLFDTLAILIPNSRACDVILAKLNKKIAKFNFEGHGVAAFYLEN